MRHVLYVDPDGDFVMTAITWLPGQVSPIHGHQVWCAFGVAEGELTEERFSSPQEGMVLQKTNLYRSGRIGRARPRLQRDPPRLEPLARHDSFAAPLRRERRAADHWHQPDLPQLMALVVISTLALKGALEKSRTQLEQTLGTRLELHFDATQAILPRLAAGFRADLVVLTAEAMEELRQAGRVAQVRALGSSGVGIAVRAGAPKPDIGSVEALKRALEAASSVAHSKVGASGIYFAELLGRLQVTLKKRVVVEKGPVGLAVARGEAELGVQQLCELEPVPGIDIVGPLPAAVQRTTRFAAGVAADAPDPAAARSLLERLPTIATGP